MKSAYVQYKDTINAKLLHSINIGSLVLDIFVWRTISDLHRNTIFDGSDYYGAYVPYPGRKSRSGLFGEIHLVVSEINEGYVAHEIQHFIYDWCSTYPTSNEKQASLAGDITQAIWVLLNGNNTLEISRRK